MGERERLKKEQLRKEGKLLTAKQKADKARAEAMIENLRAQGVDVPAVGEKRGPRPGTRVRPNKKKPFGQGQQQKEEDKSQVSEKTEEKEDENKKAEEEKKGGETDDDVKASWDKSEEEDV